MHNPFDERLRFPRNPAPNFQHVGEVGLWLALHLPDHGTAHHHQHHQHHVSQQHDHSAGGGAVVLQGRSRLRSGVQWTKQSVKR